MFGMSAVEDNDIVDRVKLRAEFKNERDKVTDQVVARDVSADAKIVLRIAGKNYELNFDIHKHFEGRPTVKQMLHQLKKDKVFMKAVHENYNKNAETIEELMDIPLRMKNNSVKTAREVKDELFNAYMEFMPVGVATQEA